MPLSHTDQALLPRLDFTVRIQEPAHSAGGTSCVSRAPVCGPDSSAVRGHQAKSRLSIASDSTWQPQQAWSPVFKSYGFLCKGWHFLTQTDSAKPLLTSDALCSLAL